MDVLLRSLTDSERQDPLWIKIEAYLKARTALYTRKLVSKNDEEARGRVKELEFLLSPPAEEHTAFGNHPRESADEGGV